ncbi:aspartate dehydrogenase [Pusillimonas caeni]|uniref:aspartate dehydrogenase n=1 Tax=Pusillimonas caeni TaxID=1348472 RepID=UPI000E59A64C|nr:aspartate dehydrogenase [Pusillimonas caeni]TFL10154.1 aspartate dehydrogenase [Pusillimonas caeni]
MMTIRHVALIGLGGIARTVIDTLQSGAAARIAQVVVRPGRTAEAARTLPSGVQPIDKLEDLAPEVSLVIETAGHQAVSEYGANVLALGRDFGLISSGALADRKLLATLRETAERHGRRLLVFNGAVAALDAICSARAAGLKSLCYTGIKPPEAWAGTPAAEQFDLAALRSRTVIFEGSARQVAAAYPKNANVAATLALAGLGMEDTRVRLVADPHSTVNRHLVEGESMLGRFSFDTEAKPLASNPKTSASTAYSIVSHLLGGPNALRLN